MIFKNLVLQALGTIRFQFLQKKSKKKFHACVPLSTLQGVSNYAQATIRINAVIRLVLQAHFAGTFTTLGGGALHIFVRKP
jgi:hypothetical protein